MKTAQLNGKTMPMSENSKAPKVEIEMSDNSGLACEYGYSVNVIELSKAIELAETYAVIKVEEAVQNVINYIENDAEIAIPIEDLMGENGIGLTKKQYGLVLLKHLVIELRQQKVLDKLKGE